MGKENTCQQCVEKLIDENRELWSEAVTKIGDCDNPDWCSICEQLFLKNDEQLRIYHDLEIDD